MALLEFFTLPFMIRALIAGAFLGVLLSSLGVFVALRRMTFFGEGIAHASLAGIAIALLTGFAPLPVAMLWAVFLAVLIFLVERHTRLSSDTILGIFFTSSMALGVVLMNQTTGYQPELLSFLFGNILSVSVTDLWIIALTTILIMIWLLRFRGHLTFLSLCEEQALVRGIPVKIQTLLLYIALSVATVLGVKILGIVLISALLILPPAISRLYTKSFHKHLLWSAIFAELIIFFGILFSYFYDLPSGATIVLVGSGLFFLSLLMKN